MELNEKIQELVRETAIIEVNSSMTCVSIWLVIRKEVITKRQNPRRFAEVFKMCWDVLVAILTKINKKAKAKQTLDFFLFKILADTQCY